MNDEQRKYANIDKSLHELLSLIDMFYPTLPKTIKEAYDNLGKKPTDVTNTNDFNK